MVLSHDAMRAEYEGIAATAEHVRINVERLRAVAPVMREQIERAPRAAVEAVGSRSAVLTSNTLDTLQYYLILTAQQFLIWERDEDEQVRAWEITVDGQRHVGSAGIVACHRRALQSGTPLLDPHYLASMSLADVEAFYRDEESGAVTLQLLPQRLAKFNEIGRVLLSRYEGHVAAFLRRTNGYLFRPDGEGLVQRLCLDFPLSYYDWPFCKLAFLVASLWNSRLQAGLPTTPEYHELAQIHDPEHMEIAADYYIPLFFLRTGIFELSPALGQHLARQLPIAHHSRMEREFRAATMVAGRLLQQATGCTMEDIDHECWRMGYQRCRVCRQGITDAELPCAYRHLSVAYQESPDLMAMRWPLVLTMRY